MLLTMFCLLIFDELLSQDKKKLPFGLLFPKYPDVRICSSRIFCRIFAPQCVSVQSSSHVAVSVSGANTQYIIIMMFF